VALIRPFGLLARRTLVGPADSLGAELGAFALVAGRRHQESCRLGTGFRQRGRAPPWPGALVGAGRVSAPVPRPLCARLDVAAWSLEIRPPDPELVGHMGATD